MGFLDNARKKLQEVTRGLGEETVRVVDYDDPSTEEPEARQPKPLKKEKVEEHAVLSSYEDSAFEVDDQSTDFFKKQEEAHQELLKSYGNTPVPKVLEGRIQDVLELLDIPATFEIDSTVLLPEDFKEISFDIQIPQGYEMGEVNAFVSRAKHSISELVELLKLRNRHIAELATTVDRLQVDASNLKFQTEIASGINIMPTEDNETIENENMELRLLVKRLEDQLKATQNGAEDSLTSRERQMYEDLADKVSVLQREHDLLKEENYSLKSQLAVYEDEQIIIEDDDTTIPSVDPKDSEFYTNDEDDDVLPSFSEHDFEPVAKKESIPEISSSSAFASDDEESLETFLDKNSEFYNGHDYSDDNSGIEFLNDDGSFSGTNKKDSYYYNDDDDDELDAIFNSDRNI